MGRFYPLFSSSKGNSSFVGTLQEGILIDAGASCKKILAALACNSIPLSAIKGIFITHSHSDHVQGLTVLTKKLNVPVYGSTETLAYLFSREKISSSVRTFPVDGKMILCGGCEITAFPTMHDAAGSVGFRIRTADDRLCAVCTDLGRVTPEVKQALKGCDMVLLEANYDPEMLRNGDYPQNLKQRITSGYGHLSNQESAETANFLVRNGTTRILLGHLSQENNQPVLAGMAVVNGLKPFRQNIDYLLGIAPVETPGGAVVF